MVKQQYLQVQYYLYWKGSKKYLPNGYYEEMVICYCLKVKKTLYRIFYIKI